MADWLERIKSVITPEKKKEEPQAPVPPTHTEYISHKTEDVFAEMHFSTRTSKFANPKQHQPGKIPRSKADTSSPSTIPPILKEEEPKPMTAKDTAEENIKALKRLRELPRGTQVDSRIAAIENLLGELEIFRTLQMLRWPQGIVCPRCHSSNVVRRDPPSNAADKRHYYICLNCKGDGSPSDFDDFTGLPINSLFALRQWILCWYLIGFCSISQIAKVLGISMAEVLQIANLGTELADLPEASGELSAHQGFYSKKKSESEKRSKAAVEQQEDYTRSASKSPFKPGYKSKK